MHGGRQGAPADTATTGRDHSPTWHELVARITWLITLRWLAALGILAGGSVVTYVYFGLAHPERYVMIAGLALFVVAYNALFVLLWRRAEYGKRPVAAGCGPEGFANVQIGVDLLSLTVCVAMTGGYASPFLAHYVFHAVIASILLSSRAAYGWATAGVLLGAAVVLGGAPPEQFYVGPAGVYVGGMRLIVMGGLVSLLYVSVYLAVSIVRQLREREVQAQQLMEETRQGAELLAQAYESLQATQVMQTAYMRRVSHELRSPLAAISTSLQVVLEGYAGELPAQATEPIRRAHRRIEELLRLVNDLLTLSRARSARPPEYMEPVNVPAVASEVLLMLAARAADRGVVLGNEVPDDLPTPLADRDDLAQLLTNLTANAIKYTDPGGRVTVSARADGDYVVLQVSDTGIGIEPEEIPRIFDEFYRTRRGRDYQAVGTGLGLTITKAIVDQHGGDIQVESTVGAGTTFTVRLPLGRSAGLPRLRPGPEAGPAA